MMFRSLFSRGSGEASGGAFAVAVVAVCCVAIVAGFLVSQPGCAYLEQMSQIDDPGELVVTVSTDAVDVASGLIDEIDQAIAATEQLYPDSPELARLREKVNRSQAKLQDMQQVTQQLALAEDAVAELVRQGAIAAAPAAGPYAPLVAVGGTIAAPLISGLVGLLFGRRTGKKDGVARVVQPIEKARVRNVEQDLLTAYGRHFLVVDQSKVAMAHAGRGVAEDIYQATQHVISTAVATATNAPAPAAGTATVTT